MKSYTEISEKRKERAEKILDFVEKSGLFDTQRIFRRVELDGMGMEIWTPHAYLSVSPTEIKDKTLIERIEKIVSEMRAEYGERANYTKWYWRIELSSFTIEEKRAEYPNLIREVEEEEPEYNKDLKRIMEITRRHGFVLVDVIYPDLVFWRELKEYSDTDLHVYIDLFIVY